MRFVFTNSNYNNRGNTTFIRDVLTGVGYRKAALIYRCSRTLSEEEVREHTQIVQNNLYGEDGDKWIVGTFRVNEDDAVADGSKFMRIDPLSNGRELHETLASLDVAATRSQILVQTLQDVTSDARKTRQAATLARDEISLYGDAVRLATSWATTRALKAFPQAALLRRFLENMGRNPAQALEGTQGGGNGRGGSPKRNPLVAQKTAQRGVEGIRLFWGQALKKATDRAADRLSHSLLQWILNLPVLAGILLAGARKGRVDIPAKKALLNAKVAGASSSRKVPGASLLPIPHVPRDISPRRYRLGHHSQAKAASTRSASVACP